MREKLGGTRCREPDNIAPEDIPPWQVVTSLIYGFRALPHENEDKAWTDKERERIEELVNHGEGNVRVGGPTVSFREKGPHV